MSSRLSSREQILGRLRQGQVALPGVASPEQYRSMAPMYGRSVDELRARFIQEAETAGCRVHVMSRADEAIETILELVGDDRSISAWDMEYIGVDRSGRGAFPERDTVCGSKIRQCAWD
ncbi:MAG: hypothetical protein R3C44_18855 [Chloroflexota bacterium]